MVVKDLIAILKKYDENKPVIIRTLNNNMRPFFTELSEETGVDIFDCKSGTGVVIDIINLQENIFDPQADN